jgi:hypothetical protein
MEDIQGSGGSWHGFITTNAMTFGPDLLMSAKLTNTFLSGPPSQSWHGLAPMGHQEPTALFSITHQIHMEDIQGSGGSWHGFMTTNAMTFLGPDFADEC